MYTKRLLLNLGMEEYWNEQRVKETRGEWGELVSKKIHEREQREWRLALNKSPKLRTYRLVKKNLEHESCLDIDYEAGRKTLARLGSRTNGPRIETGRHEGLERRDRICWFGCEEVEHEQHFPKERWMYEDLREEVMSGMAGVQFQVLSLEKLLGKGSRQDIDRAVIYIRRALGRRKRILELREGR